MAEKYYSLTPYNYCGNNPMNKIDPDGKKWKDPKEANKLKQEINNRINTINMSNTKMQNKIDKGNISEKRINRLKNNIVENNNKNNLLNQSIKDIETIGNAAETYRLTESISNDNTYGVVKDAYGVINIEGSNTGLHIHEIRHIGQSIKAGGVRFNKEGYLLNPATTLGEGIKNEVDAYQAQYSFDGSFPNGANSLKDINGTTLMKIKKQDGSIVYIRLKEASQKK